MISYKALLGFVFLLIHQAWCESPFALPPVQDHIADQVLSFTLERKYSEALELSSQLEKTHPGAASFFRNMVRLSQFDDLGDTSLIYQIHHELDSLELKDSAWEALRCFQLGYASTLLGHPLQGALQTRSAAKIFAKLPGFEAKAFHSLYEFYLEEVTAWIPGVSDDREEHIQNLSRAAYKQSWFWPLFATSVTWMLFDQKNYEQALDVVHMMLQRAPQHPVFLQMEADMLYRLTHFNQAAQFYTRSARHYQKNAPYSIRYYSAVANLIRIHYMRQSPKEVAFWQAKLKDPHFEMLKPWMPHSLLQDLNDKNLLP